MDMNDIEKQFAQDARFIVNMAEEITSHFVHDAAEYLSVSRGIHPSRGVQILRQVLANIGEGKEADRKKVVP